MHNDDRFMHEGLLTFVALRSTWERERGSFLRLKAIEMSSLTLRCKSSRSEGMFSGLTILPTKSHANGFPHPWV
jgi:hypothetical protein